MLSLRTTRALTLLATLVPGTAAFDLADPAIECVQALVDVYSDFSWPGAFYGSYYTMLCQEPNAVVSLYAAAQHFCSDAEQTAGYAYIGHYCQEYGAVPLRPPSDALVVDRLTPDAVAALPVYAQTDLVPGGNVTAPFVPDDAWFSLAFRTEHTWNYEERMHAYYTYAGFAFWGAVVLVGAVHNACRRQFSYADADVEGPARRGPAGIVSRTTGLVRKYVTTPSALPPYHQTRVWGCTVPTRAEGLVVGAYWVLSVVLGCASYSAFEGNLYWTQPAAQIWRYLSDRTGIMAYGNLVLLWAFSGRNNVLLWVTGWSFGTFNTFHRHVARIATLQAIVHSIGYTFFFVAEGKWSYYAYYATQVWFVTGIAATVAMALVVGFSFSVVRARLYEHFLLVHIALSAMLLAFLWYHTAIFDMDEYNRPFLVPVLVVWGVDRLLRVVRQLYVNVHVRRHRLHRPHRPRLATTPAATVAYDADANMLAIDIVPANTSLRPAPGQHYYLYQPLRFLGWQNHPFTLAHWRRDRNTDTDGDDLHLAFWVRPYDGWTKTLMQQCLAAPGHALSVPLLIEGPYGHSEPTHTFDQVLLVAGGSGIAGVFPYLLDHLHRTHDAHGPRRTRTRHITLLWTDRSAAYLVALAQGPLAPLLGRPDVTVALHSSGTVDAASTKDADVVSPASPATPTENENKNDPAFCIQSGRPDVPGTVRRLAETVRGTDARLAVMVCGPSALADNVRSVVVDCMEPGRGSIAYFEESFGW